MKVFLTLLFLTLKVFSLELYLGTGYSFKGIGIYSRDGHHDLAYMDNMENPKISPFIGTLSKPKYFKNTNIGYLFQSEFTTFNIDRQDTADPNSDDIKIEDLGTSVKGYSIVFVPTVFYHFFKSSNTKSLKIASGFGLGYLDIEGDFIITDKKHIEYGEKKEIKQKRLGVGGSFFIDYSYYNHSIILRFYGSNSEKGKYQISQDNTELIYRYRFEI